MDDFLLLNSAPSVQKLNYTFEDLMLKSKDMIKPNKTFVDGSINHTIHVKSTGDKVVEWPQLEHFPVNDNRIKEVGFTNNTTMKEVSLIESHKKKNETEAIKEKERKR